jgi:hypothetical protein
MARRNDYDTTKFLAEATLEEKEEHLAWYSEQYNIKLDRSEKMDELLEA